MFSSNEETNLVLKAKEDIIFFVNESVDYNELLNLSVIDVLTEKAEEYYFNSPFVNELYRDFFLPYICIEEYLKNNRPSLIDVSESSDNLRAILLDYASKNGIQATGIYNHLLTKIKYNLAVVGTVMYLALKQLKNKKCKFINKENRTVAFCRTPAAYKKIIKILKENILYESSPGVGDMYGQLTIGCRLKCLVKAIRQQKVENNIVKRFFAKNNYNSIFFAFLEHYKKRAVHTFFYENVVNEVIKQNTFNTFVTGNNLDRFAVLEERIAKDNKLKLVCIPHGIEYGYKFPKCFVGDEFFTMSQNAADSLNRLYATDKFIFDKSVVNKLFRNTRKISDVEPRIIYFSEPREPEVNIRILKELLQYFKEKSIPIFIKHHPKDVLSDYVAFDGKITEIKDLDEAICRNICLSRKSTTLLEGVYNDSQCAAIIINQKDKSIFFTFPSLQDEHIAVYYTVKEAAEWAFNQYELMLK